MSKTNKKVSFKKVSSKKFIKENHKDYMPKGAITYVKGKTKLDAINRNKAVLKVKLKNLLKKGRVKIETQEQLLNFPKGSLVSYITNEGLYRNGGFLKAVKDEYFVLQGGTFAKPISFSVQFDNVKEMYVGNPHTTTGDDISIAETNKEETNFPVKIGKKVIYYAKDRFDRSRFKETEKYQNMRKWYELFGEHKENFTSKDKIKMNNKQNMLDAEDLLEKEKTLSEEADDLIEKEEPKKSKKEEPKKSKKEEPKKSKKEEPKKSKKGKTKKQKGVGDYDKLIKKMARAHIKKYFAGTFLDND